MSRADPFAEAGELARHCREREHFRELLADHDLDFAINTGIFDRFGQAKDC
jgi:hypothetical protein